MLYAAILVMATVLGPADVEKDGVRIHVDVHASDYTFTVWNVGAEPIMSFEIPQSNAYLFRAPDGWSMESDLVKFRAWTDDRRQAIRRRNPGTFSMRVSTKGAVLGEVDAEVGLKSGETVVLPKVWGVVPEPRSTVLLVSAVVGVLIVFHTLVLTWLERRALRRSGDADRAGGE